MNTWRARRFSVNVTRRYRLNITVRRFRLAKRPKQQGNTRQLLLNIHVGRIRQVCLECKRAGRVARRQPSRLRYRYQTATASLLIVFGLSGIAFSAVALAKPTDLQPTKTFSTVQPPVDKKRALPKSVPTTITIASQNINTDLISTGLNADGTIELPPVLDTVAGWYKYGPTPGELGPAVIVGHVDSYQSISVFWRLRYVAAGDIIDVARSDGSVAHFRVTQLAQYDQSSFPTDAVYGNTKQPELRVITCGGTFDTATGHYTENTVVFAALVL